MKSNLETVQSIYEAFGKGDIPTILSHLADDIQWEAWADNSAQKHYVPWLKPHTGKDGVLAFFGLAAQLNIIDFQVLSMMDGGHQVAAEVVIEAAPSSLGKGFRDEEVHLWSFNDAGKVIRMRHYTDTYKHIQAAQV